MKGTQEAIETLVARIGTLTKAEILTIVAGAEKFSPERNQAMLQARQLAFKNVEHWTVRLNEVENAVVRVHHGVLGAKADTLQLVVFRVALEGAALATMTKPGLTVVEYRRLVKPAAQVIEWLGDETGANAPAQPEVPASPDDDEDGPTDASEENDMAIATKPPVKSTAKKKPAAVAPEPKPEPVGKNGNGDTHQPTSFLAEAKKEGVRIKPTRGGFSVCVIGANHRVLTGHYASAELAKKGAESKGLTVKKMPGQRAEAAPVAETEAKAVDNILAMKAKPGIERAAETIKAETKSATKPAPKPSAKKK